MNSQRPARQIGLTGGIAWGNRRWRRVCGRGAGMLIDTDQIAHQVLVTGTETWKIVVDAFGPSILQRDQSIDRKVLNRLVFADPQQRAKLNEITHPAIRSVWQREREERARTHPTQSLAVMIPLLFECALEPAFSAVWCVGATRRAQINRMTARGLSPNRRPNSASPATWPVAEKMARAARRLLGRGNAGDVAVVNLITSALHENRRNQGNRQFSPWSPTTKPRGMEGLPADEPDLPPAGAPVEGAATQRRGAATPSRFGRPEPARAG